MSEAKLAWNLVSGDKDWIETVHTERAKVAGGWLYRTLVAKMDDEVDCAGDFVSVSMCFVPEVSK